MRITDNSNFGTIQESLNRSRARLEDLQMQSATLKKVNRPSDDPIGAAKVLEVRTDKVNNEQFEMNAKLAESFLENTDHAVADLAEVVARAKEIAIGQSSGASSTNETRLGVAEEVDQLFQRAISTANTRIGDRFIFGGFKNQNAPVDAEGRYHGDDGEIMIEVAREVYLGMNVPGVNIFNTQPQHSADFNRIHEQNQQKPQQTRTLASKSEQQSEMAAPNVNLFQELKALRIGLLTGDLDTVRNCLENFDALFGQLNSMRAKVGARIQSIEGTVNALEKHNITNAQLTSSIEDADMAQVMSDLAKEETVFRSALASSKHLIQPTLLDFLK